MEINGKIRIILATLILLVSILFSISKAQSLELVGSCELTGDPKFIAVEGDFAYIGGFHPLLQVIKISDPENPYVVGVYDTTGRTWDLYAAKGHVFIAGDGLLFIIDVSDPVNPSLISTFEPYFVAHDVAVINNIAYLLDCNILYTLDISEIAEPELLFWLPLHIAHADRMAIRGNYAYIESYGGNLPSGMRIVSIEDPSNPVLLGGTTEVSAGQDIVLVQNYAYIPRLQGIKIVNISNPSNPYLAGEYDVPNYTKEIYVEGDYAFLAENEWPWQGGIQILDISQLLEPQLILSYNEYNYNDVFYCNGLLYTTRAVRKFDIFRFSAPTNVDDQDNLPNRIEYLENFPNPFNSSTNISYTLNEAGIVNLSVYNIQGQRVAELIRGIREAGEHSIIWDASDYPSGVYFARLESGGSSRTAKMVLLK